MKGITQNTQIYSPQWLTHVIGPVYNLMPRIKGKGWCWRGNNRNGYHPPCCHPPEEEDREQEGLFLVEFTGGDPQAESTEVGEEVLLSTIYPQSWLIKRPFVSVIVELMTYWPPSTTRSDLVLHLQYKKYSACMMSSGESLHIKVLVFPLKRSLSFSSVAPLEGPAPGF